MTDKQLKERISKMTLEEKTLELTQYNHFILGTEEEEQTVTGRTVEGELSNERLWRIGSILNAPSGEAVAATRKTRRKKGIEEPLIVMHDVIHGYRTIYPVPLAMACSFDMALAEACAEMAAIEAKYDGVDVTFAPMVDLGRDARWGRVMESGGEDPYLGGELGKAFIRGYHKGGIACCVKHFAAYGAAEAGMDYNTTDVSVHTLKEYYLRGYQACMSETPEMVMSSFNALNGVPILGCKEVVVDILRKEWGFDGVLISDYRSVAEMIAHGYTENYKEAAATAIGGKLDIEMCSPAYVLNLPELIAEGRVKESDADEAVFRVLSLKNKLGLYENPDRFTDFGKRDKVTLCAEHRALARRAAAESAVLLKNDGTLPLDESLKTAFIGPFAAEKEIFGNWGCHGSKEETISVKEGAEALLGREVLFAEGCSSRLLERDESGIAAAVEKARSADVIVACVGEYMYNSGEAHSRTDLSFPKVQKKLIGELKKLQKPLVLVVFGGRPQVLTEEESLADAILYVWQPGTEGGNAIADLLYGKAVPSGKTAMSFPRAVGQCPIYYNRFSTGRPKTDEDEPGMCCGCVAGYDDEKNSPLYPFGYGLSYTNFEYTGLRLTKNTLGRGEKIAASVCVKNKGKRDGKEVVQWYIHDKFASCVRPVKELKGFEKIFLKAGEEKTASFEIDEDTLAFYTASGEFKAESGGFELFVGGNSRDCLKAEFSLK